MSKMKTATGIQRTSRDPKSSSLYQPPCDQVKYLLFLCLFLLLLPLVFLLSALFVFFFFFFDFRLVQIIHPHSFSYSWTDLFLATTSFFCWKKSPGACRRVNLTLDSEWIQRQPYACRAGSWQTSHFYTFFFFFFLYLDFTKNILHKK